MISLLQQTAPAAVETTTTGSVTTYTVPLSDAPGTATVTAQSETTVISPVQPDAVVVPADPPTFATDAIVVPNATGAETAPPLAQPGMGHAPVLDGSGVAAVTTTPSGEPVIIHGAPGTDAAQDIAAGGADAAAAVGMPQLDASTFGNQIFWLLIALAVIYFALSRVALPRIRRILADRQGLMTTDLMAAEDFKQKAREAEAAYDKALADARGEANKIVAANRAEIQADLDAAIARADAEISARTVESERRINEIRATATQDARTVAQDVAAELVRTFGSQPDMAAVESAVDDRMKGAAQ